MGRAGHFLALTKAVYVTDTADDQLSLHHTFLRHLYYKKSDPYTILEGLPSSSSISSSSSKEKLSSDSNSNNDNDDDDDDDIALTVLDWYQDLFLQLSDIEYHDSVIIEYQRKRWRMKSTGGEGCIAHHSGPKKVPILDVVIREMWNFDHFSLQDKKKPH